MHPSDKIIHVILQSLANSPGWQKHLDHVGNRLLTANVALSEADNKAKEFEYGNSLLESLKSGTDFSFSKIQKIQEALRQHIKEIRAREYSYVIKHPDDGHVIAISMQDEKSAATPSPTDPNEALVQALRFLDGMLLFVKQMPELQEKLMPEIKAAMADFYSNWCLGNHTQVDAATGLEARFAKLLAQNLENPTKLKRSSINSHELLVALRDLTVQMQPASETMTVTQHVQGDISISRTEPMLVAKSFYTEDQLRIWQQGGEWFSGGKTLLHLGNKLPTAFESKNDASTVEENSPVKKADFRQFWYNLFHPALEEGSDLALLKLHRVSAPPSSRYSHLPGNARIVSRLTFNSELELSEHIVEPVMGTVTGFTAARDTLEQKEAAKKQLASSFDARMSADIARFRKEYAAVIDTTGEVEMFVASKRILSPLKLDSLGMHEDNNTRFMQQEMAAMLTYKDQKSGRINLDGKPVRLQFHVSNTAINTLANKPRIIYSDEDILYGANAVGKDERLELVSPDSRLTFNAKFFMNVAIANSALEVAHEGIFSNLSRYLLSGIGFDIKKDESIREGLVQLRKGELFDRKKVSLATQHELANRIEASFNLKRILYDPSYLKDDVQVNFRNIIQVACEDLSLGCQQSKTLGCKSARDRTAVELAAIFCLSRDMSLIERPKELAQEMIKEIVRGHLIRNPDQISLAKIDDVDKFWMKELPTELQRDIKQLKRFMKTFEGDKTPSALPKGFKFDDVSSYKEVIQQNIATLEDQFTSNSPIHIYLQQFQGYLVTTNLIEIQQRTIAMWSEQCKQMVTTSDDHWQVAINAKDKTAYVLEFLVKAQQMCPWMGERTLEIPSVKEWAVISETRDAEQGGQSLRVAAALQAYHKAHALAMSDEKKREKERVSDQKNSPRQIECLQKLYDLQQELNIWIAAKPQMTKFMQHYDKDLKSNRGAAILWLKELVEHELHKSSVDLTVQARDNFFAGMSRIAKVMQPEQLNILTTIMPDLPLVQNNPATLAAANAVINEFAGKFAAAKLDQKPKLFIEFSTALTAACPEYCAREVPSLILWNQLSTVQATSKLNWRSYLGVPLKRGKATERIDQAYAKFDEARRTGKDPLLALKKLEKELHDWQQNKATEKRSQRLHVIKLFEQLVKNTQLPPLVQDEKRMNEPVHPTALPPETGSPEVFDESKTGRSLSR